MAYLAKRIRRQEVERRRILGQIVLVDRLGDHLEPGVADLLGGFEARLADSAVVDSVAVYVGVVVVRQEHAV